MTDANDLSCKKEGCGEEVVVLLHGRFPFCREHYMDVIRS